MFSQKNIWENICVFVNYSKRKSLTFQTVNVLDASVTWNLMRRTEGFWQLLCRDRENGWDVSGENSNFAWCDIVKIGPDIILVKIDEKDVKKKLG